MQGFFVNCATVAKADAQSIVDALKRSIEHIGLSWEVFVSKLVGMGIDGASVMLGSKNGVAAILRREQPQMVAVHCYAHKLELAFKDATRKIALDNKVTICMLQGLYYLYHNSALNRSNLKASFDSLGLKIVMPTRIGGTRWVGHLLRALINFMNGYNAIKRHLEQVASSVERVSSSTSGKAKGLLKLMKSKDAIQYAHCLADILTVLARLSTCSFIQWHSFKFKLGTLNDNFNRDGPYLKNAKNLLGLTDEWHMRRKEGESFPSSRIALIEGIVASLSGRFEMEGVIKAMAIANFCVWPLPEDTKEIEDFGDEQLLVLTNHYAVVLEKMDVCSITAAIECRAEEIKDLTWERVNRLYPQYQHILGIMDLILTIPGASSECERGFRQLKGIKTDFRSTLKESALSDQLLIKLHSPSVEAFDPTPAIRLWNKGAARRPLFMDNQAQRNQQELKRKCSEEIGLAVEKEGSKEKKPRYSETDVQVDVEQEGHATDLEQIENDSEDEEFGEQYVNNVMLMEGV